MPDFQFVGGSYEAPSIYQDAQECINWYCETDPTKQEGARGRTALYPTPGLVEVAQLQSGEVRGMRALSGESILLVAAGNGVYTIDSAMTAVLVGTLNSNSGPVVITDNVMTSQGLTAYLVDGSARYIWVAATNTFTELTSDGLWAAASSCDVVDNYVCYNQPGTQNWAVTDLGSPYSTTLFYGTKDSAPDNLQRVFVDHRQVYLFGDTTTEVWVDTGGGGPPIAFFPFERISGTTMQHGIAGIHTAARFGDSIAFVSKDARGQATVATLNGYQLVRISTHAVEHTLATADLSSALAYTYRQEGHEFYVLNVPSINVTWVYDLATSLWHKWLSYENGAYQRHRSNCAAFFNGDNYVGDYENGKVYRLDQAVYSDNGVAVRRLRRCPHLVTDLQRQYFDELQIQFQPGVGLVSGQGSDPQAMLRWSNDGGSTWSSEHWVSIGAIGQYRNRAIWRRLGMARDRVFEVVVSDPVYAAVISANLKATEGAN